MRLKKTAALGFAAVMTASAVLSGCSAPAEESTEAVVSDTAAAAEGEETAAAESEIEKPEKITMMANGTIPTKVNNRDAFEKK